MLPVLLTISRAIATATLSPGNSPTNQYTCSQSGVNGVPAYCDTGLPQVSGGSSELTSVLQIVFGILAVVAVLFIVIGAFRIVYSQGNPENTSKARSTIIYAVVGLVISLSAEGLITFVLGKL